MPIPDPFLLSALEHITEGVFCADIHNRMLFCNRAAADLCGFTPHSAIGKTVDECFVVYPIDSDTADDSPCLSQFMAAATAPTGGRFFLEHRDGHRLPVELRLVPVFNAEGTAIGIQGIITEARHQIDLDQVNRCLHKLVRIDSTTRLPNQRALDDAIKTEYLRFVRYGIPFALVAASIDTSSGPLQRPSTAVLHWFARQAIAALRKSDLPGRLRGNLFCILLPHTDAAAAARAAEKIRIRLQLSPYPDHLAVTASFGCAAISRQDTLDRLKSRARQALTQAMDAGGNQIITL